MIYVVTIRKPDKFGLIVGRDCAAVLKQVGSVSSELGAWDAELRVGTVHESVVPLPFYSYPMRMRFEINRSGLPVVRGTAVILPEDGGGDMFSTDLPAWVSFVQGWSPDGDFELVELEVAKTAASE